MKRYNTIKIACVFAVALAAVFVCGCSGPEYETIGQYAAKRNAMFSRLQKNTLGSTQHISQAERLVDVRLQEMIAEVREIWAGEPMTAESFLRKRPELLKTDLYKFFQAMPKGAIHHIHPGAMGDYRQLIKMATYRTDCYINMSGGESHGKLGFYGSAPSGDWARCVDLREASGNAARYDADLLKMLTLDETDLYRHDKIWNNFEEIFRDVTPVLADRDLYEKFVIDSLRYLRDVENIRHVEMRAYITDALDVESWRRIMRAVNAKGPRISILLVGCDIRYGRAEEFSKRMEENMLRLAMLRKDNPDIIVGFDVYAEEDKGYSSAAMVQTILSARKKMDAQGWDMPLFLHAGETNRPPSNMTSMSDFELKLDNPVNDNVVDAVLLGSKRIGHGIGLAHRPAMCDMLRQKGIVVELNPISNIMLGYCEDLRDHIGATLLASGVPVSISPDDPGAFGHRGVALDYLMAAVAWNMDLATCKAVAENSILYSALEKPERTAALRDWRGMWDMFILGELAGPESAAATELVIDAAASEHMKLSGHRSQEQQPEK